MFGRSRVVGELAEGVAQEAVLVGQVVIKDEEIEIGQYGRCTHTRQVTRAVGALSRYSSSVPQDSSPLEFDPVDRAGQLWEQHGPAENPDVYAAMRAVTSIMRAHQILIARLDAVLRPYGVTFSRYEALVLLSYSRDGALPLSKIGERLQVTRDVGDERYRPARGGGLVRREANRATAVAPGRDH